MSTILVIDDSLTDLQITSGVLKIAGFNVVTACNEKEAKVQISTTKPDLIVLDVVLPDRSGFEFCRDLKDDIATKTIPVVLYSIKGSKIDIYWGMQQGADAYLSKPVDSKELLKTVRSFC